MRGLALILCLAASAAHAAGNEWAVAADYDKFQAWVGEDASPNDRLAAEELAVHWEMATGHAMPIADRPDAERFNIWVGGGKKIEGLFAPGDLDTLGTDGIFIKTLRDRDLLLMGGGENGSLYAVYEFLEKYLGIRWLTPETTYIPETAAPFIPKISYQFKPIFEYRYSTYLSSVPDVKVWQRRMRWVEGPGFACHSFYGYISPDEYFEDHPEYFSEVDGERISPHGYDWHNYKTWPDIRHRLGQLCMTNEAMLGIIVDKVKDRIRANPGNRMPHLSQMDWQNYCTCERCAAIDADEDSHAGSTLWGLNWIAERVAEEFPGYGIETLAYQYTRKPPKEMEVRENIAVKLCSIECDFSRPLNDPDSVLNAGFADDIRGWAAKAERLHIWNYSANFKNFQQPYPNFHVIKPNLQFFAQNNVKGVFEQGCYDHGGGFAYLRAYLISRLMWNPYADDKAIIEEFLDLYYGGAAPHLREYITLITERVQQDDVYMRCFDYGDWFDYETVEKAEALFEKAFATVDTEELRARVDLAYLPVQYAALKCPPKITVTEDTFTLTRPPSLTLDEYLQRLADLGIKHVVDYKDLDAFIQQIGGETPPRHQSSSLVKLNNGKLEVWILPEMGGSIVRLRDIEADTEWLWGFERWGHIKGVWREYSDDAPLPAFRTVMSKPDEMVVLEATLKNGLQITKAIGFDTDEGKRLNLSLRLKNVGEENIVPDICTEPAFYTQHADRVRLEATAEDLAPFVRTAVVSGTDAQTFSVPVPPEFTGYTLTFDGATRAIELSARDRVESVEVFCDARPDRAHVDVELQLDSSPLLAQGESRQARLSWRTSD